MPISKMQESEKLFLKMQYYLSLGKKLSDALTQISNYLYKISGDAIGWWEGS